MIKRPTTSVFRQSRGKQQQKERFDFDDQLEGTAAQTEDRVPVPSRCTKC